MIGRLRGAVLASWLALGVLALGPLNARAASGEGGTEEELAVARVLFADALKDEEAKHFVDALDKFQRVRAVRDTPQVEYRIGSCYEGLGQPAHAYAAYSKATELGQDDAKSADVVAASVDRVHALAKHLGWLSVTLPAPLPAGVEVRLDDVAVPVTALRDPIVLEPGPHVVTATANDAAPYRSSIVLPEGAHAALTVSLEPVRGSASEGSPPMAPPSEEVHTRPQEAPAATHDAWRRTAGWIAVSGGVALLLGAGAVELARSSDISTLNKSCYGPNGLCPNVLSGTQPARDLLSIENRATIEGPVAIGLGAGGLVAAAVGAYLVFSSQGSSVQTARLCIAPLVTSRAGSIGLLGVFR